MLDQNKMILHGLNTATVSTAVKNRVDGLLATRLRSSEMNMMLLSGSRRMQGTQYLTLKKISVSRIRPDRL
ncbi:MAG: hypothetical protein R2744_03460 [Bacteroidales bacterium]